MTTTEKNEVHFCSRPLLCSGQIVLKQRFAHLGCQLWGGKRGESRGMIMSASLETGHLTRLPLKAVGALYELNQVNQFFEQTTIE